MSISQKTDAIATSSITEQIAAWVIQTRAPDAFAPTTVQAASDLFIDWLGSALAGCRTPAGRAMLAYAGRQPHAASSIIGWPELRSPEVAALTNGALSHIVEMDDVERRSVLHPAAVVIPAALAIAQDRRLSGRDLLSAIIQGYEVAIRIGAAVGKEHYYYFHNTSTCGIFGAAAAAGSLYGLSAERLTWALGSAGTQSFGLWQFNEDATMSKHLHAGRAAAGGLLAASLAFHGLTGARAILEGERGFFRAMAPAGKPAEIVEGLDAAADKPLLHEVSLKPYPSCRHTHATIDAAKALRKESGGRVVKRFEIYTYQAAIDLCDRPRATTSAEAKFSLQYCLAAAWQLERLGLDDFDSQAIESPSRRELSDRVSVYAASDMDAGYPNAFSARVRVYFDDDTTIEQTITHPKGDPENPLSGDELEEKFRRICGLDQSEANDAIAWARGLADEGPVIPPTLSAGVPANQN